MGLSAFNAMRARMKAEAKALGKETSADVKVEEIKPAETETLVEPAEVVEEVPETKKTDAEKLKKKKEV